MQYSDIIKAWLEYLNLEELANIKVESSQIEKYNVYRLNEYDSSFQVNNNLLKLTFNDNLLKSLLSEKKQKEDEEKQEKQKQSEQDGETINLYLLFPLIKKRYKENKTYTTEYYPLFILPFSENKSNLKPKQSQNPEGTSEVEYYSKEFNTEELTEYIVCYPVFRKFLKIDDELLNSVFTKDKPFLTALSELLIALAEEKEDISFTDIVSFFLDLNDLLEISGIFSLPTNIEDLLEKSGDILHFFIDLKSILKKKKNPSFSETFDILKDWKAKSKKHFLEKRKEEKEYLVEDIVKVFRFFKDFISFLTLLKDAKELLKDEEKISYVEKLLFLTDLTPFFVFTALRVFSRISKEISFAEVFPLLKGWCARRLMEIKPEVEAEVEVGHYDFILISNYKLIPENMKIKNQLSILKDIPFDHSSKKHTPAYKFLYAEQDRSFEEYNTPSDKVWWGAYHNYSLGYGQALLCQKYASGENLIAVQGPPGTGKTTALMALIAQTLTERALSIATGKGDYSTIILVTSTANKAVENAARDFKKDKTLKLFEIYKEGFYFSYIGGRQSEDFNDSIKRIENIINYLMLETHNLEEIKNCYDKLRKRLVTLYDKLQKRVEEVNSLKNEISSLESKIKEIEQSYPNLDLDISSRDAFVEKEIKYLQDKYNYSLPQGEAIVKEKYIKHKRWLEKFQKSAFRNFTYQDMQALFKTDFEKDLLEITYRLKNRSFISRIIDFFTGKTNKLKFNFLSKYQSFISQLVSHESPKSDDFILYLANEFQKVKSLFYSLEDEKLFQFPEIYSLLEKIVNSLEQKAKLQTLKIQKEQLIEEISFRKIQPLAEYALREDGLLKLWREKYYKINRALFLLSVKFLEYHILLNRDRIVKSLKSLKKLLKGEKGYSRDRKEILNNGVEGVEQFYQDVSLVFPVFLSSLVSSPFVFDMFIKSDALELQKFIQSDYKPIHLLFIDEAGMALPHLSFPAIYWSRKVVCVGDPLQLPPVVSFNEATIERYHKHYFKDSTFSAKYSPALTSTYHRAARCETGDPDPSNIGQAVYLNEHRRCQPDIADLFKIIAGYEELSIKTKGLDGADKEKLEKFINIVKRELKITNNEKLEKTGIINLMFVNVKGSLGPEKNTNREEVEVVKKLLEMLQRSGYVLEKEENGEIKGDVGIITPYVNQERLLQQKLRGKAPRKFIDKFIGTIHKFQGTEFPVVILSTVVHRDNDSTSFVDNLNLVNVAISRAKHLFILVGNRDKLKKTKYLSQAIPYIEEKGLVIDGFLKTLNNSPNLV